MTMKIKIETRTENHVKIVEDMLPVGWVEVRYYFPHSCPWDSYGSKFLREYTKVLKQAGIPVVGLQRRETSLSPTGTGPNGSIRFGDSMLPGSYRVAVPIPYKQDALFAIGLHRKQLDDWLDGKRAIPEACK